MKPKLFLVLGGLVLALLVSAATTRAANQPPMSLHPLLKIAPQNTFVVTKTDDAGISSQGAVGTLRWAMNQANASAGFDLITFDVAGSGVKTITVKDWLPDLTDNAGVMIDGTQSDDRIQLDMGQANIYHDAIALKSSNNVIKGLIINNRPNGGVAIGTSDQVEVSNSLIIGNYLGVNAAGSGAKKAMEGIHLRKGSHDNIIGGTNGVTPGGACAGDCNLISGNYQHGIVIDHSNNNTVIGNFIGTDVNGNNAIPNADTGILIANSANNRIGGPTPEERNVISGNANINIEIGQTDVATRNNLLQGNYIGVNSAGNATVGGSGNGIVLGLSSTNTTLDSNIISGNGGTGILIFRGAARNNITNNFIGVGANGSVKIPNNGIGILVQTSGNQITDNIIANHPSHGVRIQGGSGNQIRRNAIYGNAKLGINLGKAGFTANDTKDPDNGANVLQNYPTPKSANVSNGNLTVQGSLNSIPNKKFIVEAFQNPVCDNHSTHNDGQGRTYLGTTEVNTNSNGDASFTIVASGAPATGFVVATATDSAGNTSQFSTCVAVTSVTPKPSKPVLVSPAKGATVTSNPPLLDWDPSTDAQRYEITIKQDTKKGAVVHTNSNIAADQYTPPTLAGGHKYYWRVSACNSDNVCVKSKWSWFQVP